VNRLVDKGNTLIIIEHNLDVIKCADHIIDMGPEGGKGGGKILFAGTPEELIRSKKGHTAKYLSEEFG
jgi:excinuclease ABC subunit A